MMPGYRNAAIINALRRATAHERLENFAAGVRQFRFGQERRWRISAHAAGVQALVAVQRAFVVLRRRKQFRRFAVAERVQGNLHAFEKFLNDHVRARRAKGLADHDFVHGLFRLGHVGANQNAFAQREAVGFHHAFAASAGGKFLRGGNVVERSGAAVGMPYFSMNFWEKTLDDSNCAAFWFGPQILQAVFLEQIHDAQRQRVVRADDGEINFLLLREGEQLRQIFRAELTHSTSCAVFRESFLRDAGVARRAPHLRDVRRLRQFPDQRVFASARTDDENFHFERLLQPT